MHYNKVEICGIDTSKLKVLSEKEKNELLKKVKQGDKTARDNLINGNLRPLDSRAVSNIITTGGTML